ncbi:hypothetical protein RHORCCE3_1727 [Rickettsia hoogstraalii str. RCCE3]|nr:hypothetical protein RHORCCE3_2275 [Rickettsia hoogstraalii str. RCCE3]KJV77581.1 hypothetical protein RHORCCE3_2142 [Rickettsia hoogstraalii str. RCCE3]KJV79698.1 hypothetical protein RHORCCE3_1886 [Rickettsia hoogstraalii str. RCCE3]KJV79906.1 hypothetical protein RHORCCE3_1754 [Rickettsia hoogstraalii str. RCCE3]KJV80029.1 hypothetical protein RHORCCE3_1727 [Rickettsia hoogstraalii str. RCCE3]
MNVKNKAVKEENNKQYLRIIYSSLLVIMFCVNVILPEIALGETLEGQLDRIGGLSTGKLKTIGISGATILSSIWAVVRGNLRLAGAIVAIGII